MSTSVELFDAVRILFLSPNRREEYKESLCAKPCPVAIRSQDIHSPSSDYYSWAAVMSQVGEAAKVFLTGCLHCPGRGRDFGGLQPARICIQSIPPSPDGAERGTAFKNIV